MNLKTALRVSVISQWLLFPVAIYLSYSLESYLPSQLQSWLQLQSQTDATASDWLPLIGLLITVAAMFLGSIGIYFFKRWGAVLYLGSSAVMLVTLPFLGPTVEHAMISTLDTLLSMLDGAAILLIFALGLLKRDPARV